MSTTFNMKKQLAALLMVAVLTPALAGANNGGFPWLDGHDDCGEDFTYVESHDFSDTRVTIDFSHHHKKISVHAKDGYQITQVELKVAGDHEEGFFNYSQTELDNFNPQPGQVIHKARVYVIKTCPDICPNIDGTQYHVPEGQTLVEGQCADIPEVDVCSNIDGAQSEVPEGLEGSEGECVEVTPPPTDVCANIEGTQESLPNGFEINGNECVEIATPTDVCPNLDGAQSTIPDGYELSDGSCVAEQSNSSGDSNGGGTSGGSSNNDSSNSSSSNGSGNASDSTSGGSGSSSGSTSGGSGGSGSTGGGSMIFGSSPTAPGYQVTNPTSGSGSTGGSTNTANVGGIGNAEGEVLGASCEPFIDSYLHIGRYNDPEQVKKLQEFLNEYMDAKLPVTGFFGNLTFNAVSAFQVKESKDVLKPWVDIGLLKDEKDSTGYVYKTTKRKLNMLKCSALDLPMPQLP